MSKLNKSKPSAMKAILNKESIAEERKRTYDMLSVAEKMEIALTTWHEHVTARDEINSYTTIINNQMYVTTPDDSHVLLPFAEYHGDHAMNWIITWDVKNNVEIFRKNIRMIDLIEWKKRSV